MTTMPKVVLVVILIGNGSFVVDCTNGSHYNEKKSV